MRAMTFGIVAGLLWSLIPGRLSELLRSDGEVFAVLLAGVLTGITVSLILSAPVKTSGVVATLVLGLLSMPVGAFFFGVSISVLHFAIKLPIGVSYRFVEYGFHPVRIGIQYATYGSITVFSFVFFPLAVLTTFLLQKAVRTKEI